MITEVMPETFKKQKFLEELHLAQNNISKLTKKMFVGLSNLIVLSLRKNVIESLGEEVFVYLKHLQDLDLSENRIEKLEEGALMGLSNLRVLHLRDNRLTAVPASNLALVPDLAELSLGTNYFTTIKQEDFNYTKGLKSLDLSGTALNEGLNIESFKNLSSLRKLSMESCRLRVIPSAALSSLSSLEELHIGHNPFTTLPSDVFRYNHNLHSLYISGCPELVHIEKNVLQANLNIKQVIITHNPRLTYIAQDALRLLPELSMLDLRHNNLQQISEHAATWPDIKHWYLEGNPIACNCSAAWLRTLLLDANFSASLKCASPPRLAGRALRSTEISDLACGMDSATQGLVIGLVICFLVVMIATVVVVMLYRHHDSCVHRLLKGHHIGGHGSQYNHSFSHSYHPAYTVTPTKPVPLPLYSYPDLYPSRWSSLSVEKRTKKRQKSLLEKLYLCHVLSLGWSRVLDTVVSTKSVSVSAASPPLHEP
ncbi:Leucine-rich repeat neuronal protein 2 [Portunus trituberculatus]|uniref:Leucine-rich repeat neuronal protein 2 n=1 Tax=Portunus trituberculatus TaxID=210409 RepID=A0A5B7DSP9_PORTR|nr:Leucine-rich repeat neuronal protein 2 [Portunus trituberculatus]